MNAILKKSGIPIYDDEHQNIFFNHIQTPPEERTFFLVITE